LVTVAARFAVDRSPTVNVAAEFITAIGCAAATMGIVALIERVESVTAVAVTVTTPLAGMTEGAVKVVCTSLRVAAGLKLPQSADPHVADQVTPAPVTSLVS
jgi:hypothetical protein